MSPLVRSRLLLIISAILAISGGAIILIVEIYHPGGIFVWVSLPICGALLAWSLIRIGRINRQLHPERADITPPPARPDGKLPLTYRRVFWLTLLGATIMLGLTSAILLLLFPSQVGLWGTVLAMGMFTLVEIEQMRKLNRGLWSQRRTVSTPSRTH